MEYVPEIVRVDSLRVWCDGASDIREGRNYRPAALGHPRIYMQIDETGFVDCGYCDRRFVLIGGPADHDLAEGLIEKGAVELRVEHLPNGAELAQDSASS